MVTHAQKQIIERLRPKLNANYKIDFDRILPKGIILSSPFAIPYKDLLYFVNNYHVTLMANRSRLFIEAPSLSTPDGDSLLS